GRALLDKVKGEFGNYLKDKKNIDPRDIGLYTIFIDGEALSDYKEYQDAVVESKKPKSKKKSKGVCSTCGAEENLTSNMTKMRIKYYTTNQIIFASNLSRGNYCKNMQMCQECMFKFLAGENYIINNLRTRL